MMRLSTTELKMKINALAQEMHEEMVRENSKSSAVRSYARADSLNAEIRSLETELLRVQSIQRQLRA